MVLMHFLVLQECHVVVQKQQNLKTNYKKLTLKQQLTTLGILSA